MKTCFCFITGIFALGTEVLVFLSLMEMPPFGKGGSDIIWALPFFGLVVLGLGISGLISAISVRDKNRGGRLVIAGLFMNGLSLAVPILALIFGVGRLLLSAVG
jgi:predicted permease